MLIFNALKKGEVLENPVFYKKVQGGLTLFFGAVPLIGTFMPGVSEFFTPERMTACLGFITAVNVYFIPATSDKVGI